MGRCGYLAVAISSVIGCGDSTDSTDLETSDTQSLVGVISPDQSTKIQMAFASKESQGRIPEILTGATPKDFYWKLFEWDASKLPVLVSEHGYSFNLRDASSTFAFSQVFVGPCNPALDQLGPCKLYEKLVAGAAGVSGTVSIKMTSTNIEGAYDVTIEGFTDCFGEPTQWARHGTSGGLSVPVVNP